MLSVVLESNVPPKNTNSTMNGDDGVCVVFALNRYFYSTTSVHPVSVLILHPREHKIPKNCFMMPTTPAAAVVGEAYYCGLSPLLALCTDSLVYPPYFLLQDFWGHFYSTRINSHFFTRTGVHSNHDQIWSVKIGE